MARLTRRQQQERTRQAVLTAAREEFSVHGYADGKVDRIAERAELTRGAVYSNFPSKRALYLAVLVDQVESTTNVTPQSSPPTSSAAALGGFARVWLERLPLAEDPPGVSHLQLGTLNGVLDDESAHAALTHLTRLQALLLALALESYEAQPERKVRLGELVLTMLNGSGHLAETATGFGDPFDVARACEHLADIDLVDTWDPPHLAYAAPAQLCQEVWSPPTGLIDQITGRPVEFNADGVIAVLGTNRVEAAEEAIRAARSHEQVTVAVVTSDPIDIGRLARLAISDLTQCLRKVFPPEALPRLRLVLDDQAQLALSMGLSESHDESEAAARIEQGSIIARAHGRGALHMAATAAKIDASQ